MSNETAMVTEQTTESGNMTVEEEKRGASEENKIVPITPVMPTAPTPETTSNPEAAVTIQETAPIQTAVPVQETAPVQEAAPVQETVSVQTAVQIQEAAPIQTTIPVQETTPVQTAVPVQEAAPVKEVTSAAAAPVQEPSDEIPKKKTQPEQTSHARPRSYREEPDDFDFYEDERPKKSFFRFRSNNEEESRDKLILSRIKDEDLMEYLALEQRRLEFLQQSKELKQKRLLTAFQLLVSLASIVAITYLLKDNPTILISILYIVGIIAALNIWKNPHGKDKDRFRR